MKINKNIYNFQILIFYYNSFVWINNKINNKEKTTMKWNHPNQHCKVFFSFVHEYTKNSQYIIKKYIKNMYKKIKKEKF